MKTQWKSLSLREQIAQTIVVGPVTDDFIETQGGLESFLEKYPVGGKFFGGEVIKNADKGPDEVRAQTSQWQKYSARPLAICADFEVGCGFAIKGLTEFPTQMALGATRSEALAYDYGKWTALEGLSCGVNWALAPIIDVNLNPFNQIINTRAISDDTHLVYKLASPLIQGMQENGMAANGKCFPGDGVDFRDQHMATTKNSLSRDQWMEHFGRLYGKLFKEGLASIMTGHISLPAFQKNDCIEGLFLPATLSWELTTKLLKDELGFKGVVLSDALTMGGFIKWYGERTKAEVECFKAGTDMMLWPSLGYLDAVETAIKKGEIPLARLEDALERIMQMKDRFFIAHEPQPQLPRTLQESQQKEVADFALTLGEKSLTLVRDRRKLLPIDSPLTKKVFIDVITPSHEAAKVIGESFESEFWKRGWLPTVDKAVDDEKYRKVVTEYDLIIVALSFNPHKPMGPLRPYGIDAWHTWGALAAGREKSIVVSFGSPYHAIHEFEDADTYVNAYGYCPASVKAVVRAITGEISFEGQSPVKLVI